jgi:hypothetical protein
MANVIYPMIILVTTSYQETTDTENILLGTTNKMQHFTIFFVIVNATHVSGSFSVQNM